VRILTFDIEDWFHVLDNPETQSTDSWQNYDTRLRQGVDTILQLLDETSQSATFFCLGWVSEKYSDVIRRIDDAGYEIASHSYAHQLAYDQSQEEFREDVHKSLSVLQEITGKAVNTYRAPGFSITGRNLWAFAELIDQGIKVDCSLFPADRAHGGLPGLPEAVPTMGEWEGHEIELFPINTKSILGKKFIYSGGGYFRLAPGFLLQKWFQNDQYVMTYFHPRDFDPDQPMIPGLSAVRKFKSYVGIRGARDKLRRILQDNSFMDVRTASKSVDWDSVPRVNLKLPM
jgi:polysaccharide deacetylase family protein (PEP-CTERM system associated)